MGQWTKVNNRIITQMVRGDETVLTNNKSVNLEAIIGSKVIPVISIHYWELTNQLIMRAHSNDVPLGKVAGHQTIMATISELM